MTDHDAIAARVRQDRETGTPGPWHHDADDQRRIDYTDPRSGTCWNVAYVHSHCGHPIDGSSANARRIAALPDLEAAYLDLHDEVQRLRGELAQANNEFGSETAEWPALWRRIAELKDISNDRWQRAEKAEAERDRLRTQCCMCGKTGLSTIEDGGPECELDDGRWVCSVDCYDLAVLNHLVAEAERDRLRAALNEIATAASGIAHGLQIGPDDEGRDIHEMALAIRDDARAALKGDSDE